MRVLGLCLASMWIVLVAGRNATVYTVYRAATSSSEWYMHLVNANAADKGGVLSYLHTEVIPFNQRPPVCARRWNYDIISIYEVAVHNPSSFNGGDGPALGVGFSAMDSGACTVPGCQERYEKEGFFVGGQTQKGNCRAAYGDTTSGAFWYSFPAEGQCAFPDGSSHCTYSARFVGKIKIDDLINSKGRQLDPNFHDWCTALGWEFQAEDTACPGACRVTWSIDFWAAPCDVVVCQKRMDMLKDAVKTSLVDRTLPNGCSASSPNTNKWNGVCVRDCPADTFRDWNFVCQPCPPELHCASCNWPVAPPSQTWGQGGTKCLSCGGSYPVLTAEGQCLESCPSGQFFDDALKKCSPCSSACSECSESANTCTRCPSPQWLSEFRCVASCALGEYGDGNRTCQSCMGCGENGTCTSETSCTVCGSGLYLTPSNTCVAKCPVGTLSKESPRTCVGCFSPSCTECSGPDETACTACDNSTGLENGRCVTTCSAQSFKNHLGQCTVCSSVVLGCSKCTLKEGTTAPTCLACGLTPTLDFLHAGLCKTACPVGFEPKPGPSNTSICIPLVPSNAPTDQPTTLEKSREALQETGASDVVVPWVAGSVGVVVVGLAVAGLVFWRRRHGGKRYGTHEDGSVALPELYEPLNVR